MTNLTIKKENIFLHKGLHVIAFTPPKLSLLAYYMFAGYYIRPKNFMLVRISKNLLGLMLIFDSNLPISTNFKGEVIFSDLNMQAVQKTMPPDLIIFPAGPTSSMYHNSKLDLGLIDIFTKISNFITLNDLNVIDFKVHRIKSAKAYIRMKYQSIYYILKKNKIEYIPELFNHLMCTIESLEKLCQKFNIFVSDTMRRVALLHDIGKPTYLVIEHYKFAVSCIDQYGFKGIKDKILLGEIDKRRLWKYLFDIYANIPPKLFDFAQSFINCTKDSEISLQIIDDIGISSKEKEMLKRIWNCEVKDDKTLVAIKLADFIADYIHILSSDYFEEGIVIKSKAIAYRYDIEEKTVLEKYFGYLRILKQY